MGIRLRGLPCIRDAKKENEELHELIRNLQTRSRATKEPNGHLVTVIANSTTSGSPQSNDAGPFPAFISDASVGLEAVSPSLLVLILCFRKLYRAACFLLFLSGN